MSADLAALLARQRPGRGLERDFYLDRAIHDAELARIWGRRWLFLAHSADLAEPGRFATVDVGREPLLLVRGRDGVARGFFNVCRHRGSRVCTGEAGRVHRLVCPYHAWTYDLDGRLVSDARAHEAEAATLGLKPVAVAEIEGLIFASLAASPPDIAPAVATLGAGLRPQGLARAAIAHVAEYRVAANWKLVFENNRECFHCPVAHPEYVRANYDIHHDTPARAGEIAARTRAEGERWAAMGLGAPTLVSDMTHGWFRLNRTPLVPGFATESLDGAPVGPPMGEYREVDVGTLRVTTFPNFWMHGSGDHAVTTRLLPLGPEATAVRVTWLVAAGARAGIDYQLERLLPFWQRTSEQDWTLVENVQRGVASRAYEPGPFAPAKEGNVDQFLAWYRAEMAGA